MSVEEGWSSIASLHSMKDVSYCLDHDGIEELASIARIYMLPDSRVLAWSRPTWEHKPED